VEWPNHVDVDPGISSELVIWDRDTLVTDDYNKLGDVQPYARPQARRVRDVLPWPTIEKYSDKSIVRKWPGTIRMPIRCRDKHSSSGHFVKNKNKGTSRRSPDHFSCQTWRACSLFDGISADHDEIVPG
jgi:hypothetical protein